MAADTNTSTLDTMHLAGIPIRDDDVLEPFGLLRDGGMEDIAHELDHGTSCVIRVTAQSTPFLRKVSPTS